MNQILQKGLRPFFYFWVWLFASFSFLSAQPFHMELLPIKTSASFRAISVVNDSVIWLAGTKGTFGRTSRGPYHFQFDTIPGFGKSDFRSLYAFDEKVAVTANAGSPAVILRTENGGKTWTRVYENAHPSAFFDGIEFKDEKNGAIYGDPIDGKMLLLFTNDGGKTWNQVPEVPILDSGEASFAASGTGIKYLPNGQLWLATGGAKSRLWVSDNSLKNWRPVSVPVLQGKPSQGIFSFDIFQGKKMVVVGGDYLADSIRKAVCFWSDNTGKNWTEPSHGTGGYRECVRFLDEKTIISLGPKGIDWSKDGGENWMPFSSEPGFHTIQLARKGKTILLAGAKGKVAILFRD